MPKAVSGRNPVTVIFTEEEYNQLKTLSAKTHKSMSAIVRDFTSKGLCGEVTENNIEFIAPIIREQARSVIEPMMERMISLTAKTCLQASTATYLSADAIYKFVPPAQRTEVKESYDAARKKAVTYMKSKTEYDN